MVKSGAITFMSLGDPNSNGLAFSTEDNKYKQARTVIIQLWEDTQHHARRAPTLVIGQVCICFVIKDSEQFDLPNQERGSLSSE